MTADDACHTEEGALQILTRVETYSVDDTDRATVSLWLLPKSRLQRPYPGGYAGGSWQRIHTLPPLREEGDDIERAIRAYAITQGWERYNVYGHIQIEGDTDG